MKTNSKADGKDKSSLYEESQETISYLIDHVCQKKIVYHHLRADAVAYLVHGIFLDICKVQQFQIPVFRKKKIDCKNTMPTSYVSHSKPSISRLRALDLNWMTFVL